MISSIITFSVRNKFLVLTVTAVLMVWAVWCLKKIPLDAIPDLSDTQVIVYSRWDRSPDILEDQVTYPIITALLGMPRVKAIRGVTDFGFSYVYVIFEDGTDLYWARSRTLEYMSKITSKLPAGVQTELGPDATGVGWVFQYVLRSDKQDLASLRAYQDWNLRYQIQSVPGVAEVASIGGFVKEFQVHLDPQALQGFRVSIAEISEALRQNNSESGGRLVEFSGREYMIRSRGYLRSVEDIEKISIRNNPQTGTPILIRDLGFVSLGPDLRRGAGDWNGEGDSVGGIVVMRSGENALTVIEAVKQKLEEIKPTLPAGMEIQITYDRSDLIERAMDTLKHTLIDEIVIVSLVILLFLWHFPSAFIPILTIPISVLLSFIPLYYLGITSNIMSLAGIAISIGVLVDGAIVEVENAYKRLEEWNSGGRLGDFHSVRLKALQEVGPSVFFSLLVIAAGFLPIYTLMDQEGRLFKPLASSKNLAMLLAALLAITLDPALRMLFTRMDPWKRPSVARRSFFTFIQDKCLHIANTLFVGKYYPEDKHPISRKLQAIYEPICRWSLHHPWKIMTGALLLMACTVPIYFQLGHEFMPPLNEGSLLYMPTTKPGVSIAEALHSLQVQDQILKSFPEVESVFGKVGRAESSTDPAPLSMAETVIVLKPKEQWPKKDRWYSFAPKPIVSFLSHFQSDTLSMDELIQQMHQKLQMPGWVNAWTMPIINRINMLATGIRTPLGLKIYGPDPEKIQEIGIHIEHLLQEVSGTQTVIAERTAEGFFLDFELRREDLARYGLSVEEANEVITHAIGGETVTTVIDGRERYPVNLRYARDFRDDISDLERVLITTPSGSMIPLSEIATLHFSEGPSMIRDENGFLTGYVMISLENKDLGSYVEEAEKILKEKLLLPKGYRYAWSGEYENMIRANQRFLLIIPVTLFLVFFLLYLNTQSLMKTTIVMLAVPFSLIGAFWILYLLGYHLSTAVWVGMIALMGLDAETGVFMLLFLDLAYEEAHQKGQLTNQKDLHEAIIHGAVRRIRPKMMTVMAAFIGLLPIMFSNGTGADMMKRIAAPMVGGLVTSFLLELLIYPVLYERWKKRKFVGPVGLEPTTNRL